MVNLGKIKVDNSGEIIRRTIVGHEDVFNEVNRKKKVTDEIGTKLLVMM